MKLLLSGLNRRRQLALLCSVSLLALWGGGVEARSLMAPPGSAAAAQLAAQVAAEQAAIAGRRSQDAIRRARDALDAARKLQMEAAAAARAAGPSGVPDGLAAGGLMPTNGTANDPLAGIRNRELNSQDDRRWTGANLPVQSQRDGKTTVDITQTESKAILTWQTFNVGTNTTLNFKQENSAAIALNRVIDPNAAPSRILGTINATGRVYVINRNGIIFGGGSQVNVNALVASTLDYGQGSMSPSEDLAAELAVRNTSFLSAAATTSVMFENIAAGYEGKFSGQTFGDVTVERGARIEASPAKDLTPGSYGSIFLFGTNVYNHGTLLAPTGEVALAAGRSVVTKPNFSRDSSSVSRTDIPDALLGTDDKGDPVKFRGINFVVSPYMSDGLVIGSGMNAVLHDGLVESPGGIVFMQGARLDIANQIDASGATVRSVIAMDTGIQRNGFALLRGAGTLDGVISSQPYDDGGAPLPQGKALAPTYIEALDLNMGARSLISAPSARVRLGSTLAPGAIIDVAGISGLQLPAIYNYLSYAFKGQFADMPLQRPPYAPVDPTTGVGSVYGQTLWFDSRDSGIRADGTSWVGTPLADARAAIIAGQPRSIVDLMTRGGSVTLSSASGDGRVVTTGAQINVAGGSVEFLPGYVRLTRLIGADGRIYRIDKTDPNMTYVGFADLFSRHHGRWGVTEFWSTSRMVYAPGYIEGRDAGSITLAGLDLSKALDGDFQFGSVTGERQLKAGKPAFQGALTLFTSGFLQLGETSSTHWKLSDIANISKAGGVVQHVSTETLSRYGVDKLTITAGSLTLSRDASLLLQPGATFTVNSAGPIDIAGSITAQGGSIRLETNPFKFRFSLDGETYTNPSARLDGWRTRPSIYVDGIIDVSGRFINDSGLSDRNIADTTFLNGGSITLITNNWSDNGRDFGGDIRLGHASVLDVSSGAYIGPDGHARMSAPGIMAGRAGAIALQTLYNGWDPLGVDRPKVPLSGQQATIVLDGTLLGRGFERNASLTITTVGTLRLGGTLAEGEVSHLFVNGSGVVPTDLINGGGFGSYRLESASDLWSSSISNPLISKAVLSSSVLLAPRQLNLDSLADYSALPTGTRLGRQSSPELALLSVSQRSPVNLMLVGNTISFETGSRVVLDPLARLTLASRTGPDYGAANRIDLAGQIISPGGTVDLRVVTLHFTSTALVDLSGIFVPAAGFGTPRGPRVSGIYLPGGIFSAGTYSNGAITPDLSSYAPSASNPVVVAEPGASIDVSGAAGPLQVQEWRGKFRTQWSWSDAGKIDFNLLANLGQDTDSKVFFAWSGSFAALGGRYRNGDGRIVADSRAANGRFGLLARNKNVDSILELHAMGSAVRDALEAYDRDKAPPNKVILAADQLAQFDDISLDTPILTFVGPLDWQVREQLDVNAIVIRATSPDMTRISAGYLHLSGPDAGDNFSLGIYSAVPGSRLTLRAGAIDIDGAVAFQGFDKVELAAAGDIRFVPGAKFFSSLNPKVSAVARLEASGNLDMSAQRIYPATQVNASILVKGSLIFTAPDGADRRIPLSAGGGLLVRAASIDQNGHLFAPLGTIELGTTDSKDPSGIITSSVHLGPGSLTSVSLTGMLVPYGETLNQGATWFYNVVASALSAPPSKRLVLNGIDVHVDTGAVVDLRGGGDLQAMTWIPGLGGSRDTLRTTPAGQTVYALVPAVNDVLAAIDIHFQSDRTLGTNVVRGDTVPEVGRQIRIDGGGGIPAGVYTLYPAHYATLPGAFRVVMQSADVTGQAPASGTTLPDGTVLVTGNFTSSFVPGRLSSGQTLFAVQSGTVWQRYSEYAFSTATDYFTMKAEKDGTVVPRLPVDSGRLALVATRMIDLQGTSLTTPGKDSAGVLGRGAELDLSAAKIAIVDRRENAPENYVGVTTGSFGGFDSVLIGGLRSDVKDGTLITPMADQVLVDTHGAVFSAPEIILVARPVASTPKMVQRIFKGVDESGEPVEITLNFPVYTPVDGSGAVRIAAGSILSTTKSAMTGAQRHLIFDSTSQIDVNALAKLLNGKVDSDGNITGVDLGALPLEWLLDPSLLPAGYDRSTRQAVKDAIAFYAMGGFQSGRGAMMVMSNDPNVQVTGPSGPDAFSDVTINIPMSDPNTFFGSTFKGSITLTGSRSTMGPRITVEDGAKIYADTVTLQASATRDSLSLAAGTLFAHKASITASTIAIGGAQTVPGASSTGFQALSGQFAGIESLRLRATSGAIAVRGDFDPGSAELILDAAGLVADGVKSATVTAGDVLSLGNASAAAAVVNKAPSADILKLVAKRIEVGGDASFDIGGYQTLTLAASDAVVLGGSAKVTVGLTGTGVDATNVLFETPLLRVAGVKNGGNTNSTGLILTTAGTLTLAPPAGVAAARVDRGVEVGGKASLEAGSIRIAGTVAAEAGMLALTATTGDLVLDPGASLLARGYAVDLFDMRVYGSGGTVKLLAKTGNVIIKAGSLIDVSAPADGRGRAGSVALDAVKGAVVTGGNLSGFGGPGLGGRFALDSGETVNLTPLADLLRETGFNRDIDIRAGKGNLVLEAGHVLEANRITLTADDVRWSDDDPAGQFGQIVIRGDLTARGYAGLTADGTGQAGGTVGLFGYNGVTLVKGGRIDASTRHADERGGDVTIGLAWGAKGTIDLQQGSMIDVSGGAKGGLSGGTLTLRAPLDGNNDVKITQIGSDIRGARSITIQPFLSIDTTASGHGIDGTKLKTRDGKLLAWNGVIDPGGVADASGRPITWGTWTDLAFTAYNADSNGLSDLAIIELNSADGKVYRGTLNSSGDLEVTDPVTGTVFRASLGEKTAILGYGGEYGQDETIRAIVKLNGKATTLKPTFSTSLFALLPDDPSFYNNLSTILDQSIDIQDNSHKIIGSGTVRQENGRFVLRDVSFTKKPSGELLLQFSGSTDDHKPIFLKVSASAFKKYVTDLSVDFGNGLNGSVTIEFSTPNADARLAATATILANAQLEVVKTRGYTAVADGLTTNLPSQIVIIDSKGSRSIWSPTITDTGLTGILTKDGLFTPDSGFGAAIPKTAGADGLVGTLTIDDTVTAEAAQNYSRFFTEVLADFVTGKGLTGWNGYGFSTVMTRLGQQLAGRYGAATVHVQPGLDLVNSSTAVNSGRIIVASNWNLAAGTAHGLINHPVLTDPDTGSPLQYFDPAKSSVAFTYRLLTPWGGVEPGALNLRAAGSVQVNASLSDGFFQIGNTFDASYLAYVQENAVLTPPPYNSVGNGVSPSSLELVKADLFQHTLLVWCDTCGKNGRPGARMVTVPTSWSYGITAGTDLASANPQRHLADGDDVILDQHRFYDGTDGVPADANGNSILTLPTMIRTGTGRITVSTAGSIRIADTTAPGVIYAGGVNAAPLVVPEYSTDGLSVVNDASTGPDTYNRLFIPLTRATISMFANYGITPPLLPAFPEQAGDVLLTAGQDITGTFPSDVYGSNSFSYGRFVLDAFFYNWLGTRGANGVAGDFKTQKGAGTFKPGIVGPSGDPILHPAWWIDYSKFNQGILSAGGNIEIDAGHDIVLVSAFTPSSGRVSGGMRSGDVPVTNTYGGGNLMVRAGGNILGGSFYIGSGHAVIDVRGSLARSAQPELTTPNYAYAQLPSLLIGTGRLSVIARGSIDLGFVGEPIGLAVPIVGQDSAMRLLAEIGDIRVSDEVAQAIGVQSANKILGSYPASFEATAAAGSLDLSNAAISLAPSLHGTLRLAAWQDMSIYRFSAGASLLQTGFDPFRPNSGFNDAVPGRILAHADDTALGLDTVARIYAVTGDIIGSAYYSDTMRVVINRPMRIIAGRDIRDMNVLVQNIHPGDVSVVMAGRDIVYSGGAPAGGLQVAGPGTLWVQAGRTIGPFVPDEANTPERNIPTGVGTFRGGVVGQQGIVSVGIGTAYPVGNDPQDNVGIGTVYPILSNEDNYISSFPAYISNTYDVTLLGPDDNPRRNTLLWETAGSRRGASLVVLAGVGFGADYDAVAAHYLDPAGASPARRSYLPELRQYFESIGKTAPEGDAEVFAAFKGLSAELQRVFLVQIYLSEVKQIGVNQSEGRSPDYPRAYGMIDTLFPSRLGYTANTRQDGVNGADKIVSTGDILLSHATIQTQQGGDISILVPGGNLVVGTIDAEANPALKLRDLGIMTLGQGSIHVMADRDIQVFSSRVLTTQGGDILLFSANGSLDAGRGSRTIFSAPPLRIDHDPDNYPSIDRTGFVSGSGIGTLRADEDVKLSDVYLMAPRGTINVGTAGVRISGSAVLVAPVVFNTSGLQAKGATSGIPTIPRVDVGALSSASNATAAAAQIATPNPINSRRASIYTIEVLGYGGGDKDREDNADSIQ